MPRLALPFPAGHASGSGRFRCRLSSRPLPQRPPTHAAVSAYPCRAVAGVHSAGRLQVASGRKAASAVAQLDRRCLPAALTWPGTQGVHGTGHRGSVRRTSGIAARYCRTAALRRGHGRGAPEQSRDMAVAGGRPSMHAPPATAVDARRLQCPRWQHNLDAGGCPDQGVRRTACCRSLDTAAVSTVVPEPWPHGDGVRTAGVHRGHPQAAVSAATGSGRRTGGRWSGAASAGRRG
jgi:hypothetical protein